MFTKQSLNNGGALKEGRVAKAEQKSRWRYIGLAGDSALEVSMVFEL